jgi:hypothetical protein
MIKTAQDAYIAGRQAALEKLANQDYVKPTEVLYSDFMGTEAYYDMKNKAQRELLLRKAKNDISTNFLKSLTIGGLGGGLAGAFVGYKPALQHSHMELDHGPVMRGESDTPSIKTLVINNAREMDLSKPMYGALLGAGVAGTASLINSLANYRNLKNTYGDMK